MGCDDNMTFIAGMAIGAVIAMVVWVAYFAPKHWEWYQENVALKQALTEASEERDHYKNLIRPNEWGAVAQHEARIVRTPKEFPYVTEVGDVEFQFDDIKDGGER